jgi:tetratricopeptide (TPR) repeat protein
MREVSQQDSGAGEATPRRSSLVAWRRVPVLSRAVALQAATVIAASPVGAQDPYPLSNAGAPVGVYSAPRIAIDSLRSLVREDSLDYGANWRLARALTTLGALAGDAGRLATRDSLYRSATRHARRAVRIAPDGPEGHIVLAQLLERVSTDAPLRDRVRMSGEALEASKKAVALNPALDGGWHTLGRWHVEVQRLNAVERFVGIHLLDGAVMKEASREEGVTALERAVSLRPGWIRYRLDLARAYVDLERFDDARAQLEKIASLAPIDPEDPSYQREAKGLVEWMSRGSNGFARTMAGLNPFSGIKLPFFR